MQQPLVALGRKSASAFDDETHVVPVCKMLVTRESAAESYEYKGKVYYFCAAGCRDRFVSGPEKFLSLPRAVTDRDLQSKIQNQKSKIEFTCPMHPEIVQIGPGSCPICGMALEPRTISLEYEENPE